jgi:tetratricopeptide (TPR) repeat protein
MAEPSQNDYAWSFDEAVAPAESSAGAGARPSAPLPKIGSVFGPFEVHSELGRGGMGAVFRARDQRSGRDVALKVVLQSGESDQRARRLVREGELTARLNHPGIVRVHSSGEVEDQLYLAYELVEGAQDLAAAFAENDLRGRVALVRDAARALGFAHAHGVVHRDVKPDNVLVDRAGQVKVADFGLAAAAGLERLTQTGAMVGTPTHMAPEQFTHDTPPGPYTDVWALGVLLYRALTGELPFDGESLIALSAAIVDCDPKSPRALNPEVPEDLEAVCFRALVAEPTERYADGSALANDLDRYLQGLSVHASRGSTVKLIYRRLQRRSQYLPALIACTLATLVLTVAGVSWIAIRQRSAVRTGASDDLSLRARSLEQKVARLLAYRTPLAGHEARLASLEGKGAALGAEGLDVRAARSTLASLRGLLALARGDDATARAELLGLEAESVASAGLRGALAAFDAETPAEADRALATLDAAIEGGLLRPEGRAWRGVARLKAGGVELEAARDALEALALLAGDDLLAPALVLADVRLSVRTLDVQRAERGLEAVPAPPPEVAQALALAKVAVRLDKGDVEGALALARARSFPGGPDRERVVARCRELVRPLLAASDEAFDTPAVLGLLELAKVLAPEEPLAPSTAERLLDVVEVRKQRDVAIVAALARTLTPDDYSILKRLARIAAREGSTIAGKYMWVIERAIELAPTEVEKASMTTLLAAALMEAGKYRAAVKACTAALATDGLSDRYKARAHYLRSLCERQDTRQSLADLEAAADLGYVTTLRDRLHRAGLLQQLGRLDEALKESLAYVHGSGPSHKHDGSVTFVWETQRKRGKREHLRGAVERLLSVRPEYAGWRVRLGWILLAEGRAEDAAAQLEEAAKLAKAEADRLLSPRKSEALARLAPDMQRVADAIRSQDDVASDQLDELVEELEKLRTGTSVP